MPTIIKGVNQDTNRTIYVWIGTYYEKDIPKDAHFRWDPVNKNWWTYDIEKIIKLQKWASLEVMKDIKAFEQSYKESSATSSTEDFPVPEGLDYLPFQKAGIKYALSHTSTFL
jgi:SWI/SNF-related matrix-associated actin-dependent regulator 1 of chromatin subfamily A